MRWRRFFSMLAALLIAMMGMAGVTNLAFASPHTTLTLSPPKEGAKVTLGETSIDGPAIATIGQPNTVLAWTGTDSAHHLNVMTSSDGLHYSNKHVLSESSLWRPAVAYYSPDGKAGEPGTIVLAWTGTDSAHHLNLGFISLPSFKLTKITYWNETSFTAPALAVLPGDVNSHVYLAWSGTDSAHTLNTIRYETVDRTSTKHTFWGWRSISRPDLSTNPLSMAWTGPNNHIYFAYTNAKLEWIVPSSSPLSVQSAWAPSMIGFFVYSPTSMPDHWLAWTGSGSTSTRNITVRYTRHFPSWSDAGATTTLGETALSSPAMAYNGNGNTRQVLLAWAGTDSAHRLNVAFVYVTG